MSTTGDNRERGGGKPILDVRDLRVWYGTGGDPVRAVDGVSFSIGAGETLGLVGESGCGKSTLGRGVLGLLPDAAAVAGSVRYRGRELVGLSVKEMRELRGPELGLIFQEPMTRLDPLQTIEAHFRETLRTHRPDLDDDEVRRRSLETLAGMGIPRTRFGQYPHEFSGGMRQRAKIAMAIANDPAVLIADEPTTALDVTIQAQIVEVMRAAQQETDAAIILITHDLGLIAELADRVVVMYAGRVVELADVFTIFNSPRHPYTVGLMNSLARLDVDQEWLKPIPGQPPSLLNRPPGCAFHPRCEFSQGRERCRTEVPELRSFGEGGAHRSACHFAEELSAQHVTAGAAAVEASS